MKLRQMLAAALPAERTACQREVAEDLRRYQSEMVRHPFPPRKSG